MNTNGYLAPVLHSYLFSGLFAIALVFNGPTTANAEVYSRPVSLQAAERVEQQATEALSNAKIVLKMARETNDVEAITVATEAVQVATDALKKARKHRLYLEKTILHGKKPATQTYPKGNKHTAPVAITRKPASKVVDPSFFTHPRNKLTIKSVPNPRQAKKGTWLRYVKSDRANLVLDALEEGKGDLDVAISYIERQITLHGTHKQASNALSYLEGLRTSYIATEAEYKNKTKKSGQSTTIESKTLLKTIQASAKSKWPGPKNPDPASKPTNPLDWKVKRTETMLGALQKSANDLEETYKKLQTDNDIITASNAEHYLRGVYAYWDFLGAQGKSK